MAEKRKGLVRICLDFNYSMSDFVGNTHGIDPVELDGLRPRIEESHKRLIKQKEDGILGFLDLPYADKNRSTVLKMGRQLRKSCRNFVVLGIGGSALGGMALHRALNHPCYNLLTHEKRKLPRIFFADNIDPEGFGALMDILDLRETVFNVISKSGGTAETMSQFLYARDKTLKKLGKEAHKEHFVITTDPDKGMLREMVRREGYPSLEVPPNVGGRFSVLSSVGLLPAAVTGIDISRLLDGAKDMVERCQTPDLGQNPAYLNGTLYYLADTVKKKNIVVMMPYSDALYGIADWFCQLWAESLGKKIDLKGDPVNVGQTPVRALGVTDQHSQLQLYMEGPNDKIITFLVVESLRKRMAIPKAFPDMDGVHYLGGHTFNELFSVEQNATELALLRAGHPTNSIIFPEISALTIGQMLMMLEIQTVFTGGLYNINPMDQPGVEAGKQFAYGLMGRKGFEAKRGEFEKRPKKKERYII